MSNNMRKYNDDNVDERSVGEGDIQMKDQDMEFKHHASKFQTHPNKRKNKVRLFTNINQEINAHFIDCYH